MSFMNHVKNRRTIYAIGNNVNVDQAKIEETIREAIKHSPSSTHSLPVLRFCLANLIPNSGKLYARLYVKSYRLKHLQQLMGKSAVLQLVMAQFYFMKIRM